VTSGTNAHADNIFDAGIMAPQQTFEHTFTKAGKFPYYRILHPLMIGTVIVS
jgi:plastocyanin